MLVRVTRSASAAVLGILGGTSAAVMIAVLSKNHRTGTPPPSSIRPEPPSGPLDAVTADDLDKEQLEQLHAATLKASDSCFELKKLCATVLVPTGTLVALFSIEKKLNLAVFAAGLLVIVAFWLADAVGYFYQRRLRAAMTVIWERRAKNCPGGYDYVPRPNKVGPLGAAFNSSMTYYLILAMLIAAALLLFEMKIIGS